jgi:hypothetical protein
VREAAECRGGGSSAAAPRKEVTTASMCGTLTDDPPSMHGDWRAGEGEVAGARRSGQSGRRRLKADAVSPAAAARGSGRTGRGER